MIDIRLHRRLLEIVRDKSGDREAVGDGWLHDALTLEGYDPQRIDVALQFLADTQQVEFVGTERRLAKASTVRITSYGAKRLDDLRASSAT